jgi:hypothetical protein
MIGYLPGSRSCAWPEACNECKCQLPQPKDAFSWALLVLIKQSKVALVVHAL